jgi:hypothetical protein
VDFNAPTVAASELEQNPFASKSRWRALLKKPSREVIVRGGIALLALGVGIGIGAKPWKASRATPSAKVVAAHAAPKKPQVATQSARANLVAKPAPYRAATPSHAAQTNRFPAPAKPAAAKATTQPNGSKTATSKTATSKTATSKTAAHPAGAKSTTTRTASTATHQK